MSILLYDEALFDFIAPIAVKVDWSYRHFSQNFIYSTTKETHQSLLGAIMENRKQKRKYIYTIFLNNQFCINSLKNVTVLLKSVDAVRHCIDKGSFSKMTSFSLENE